MEKIEFLFNKLCLKNKMAAELVANEYRGEIQQGNYDFNNKTILDVQMVFFWLGVIFFIVFPL